MVKREISIKCKPITKLTDIRRGVVLIRVFECNEKPNFYFVDSFRTTLIHNHRQLVVVDVSYNGMYDHWSPKQRKSIFSDCFDGLKKDFLIVDVSGLDAEEE